MNWHSDATMDHLLKSINCSIESVSKATATCSFAYICSTALIDFFSFSPLSFYSFFLPCECVLSFSRSFSFLLSSASSSTTSFPSQTSSFCYAVPPGGGALCTRSSKNTPNSRNNSGTLCVLWYLPCQSPYRVFTDAINAGLFCGDTGLFCRGTGPFKCGDTGLFCGDTGLFCGDTVLFCADTGLFVQIQGSLAEVRGSFVKILGSSAEIRAFAEINWSCVERQGSL